MKKSFARSILLVMLMCAALVAYAAPMDITSWDFLGGGDGVKWTQLINDFNASQDAYKVTSTTLPWGVQFYTRVHTGVVAGETPDVMTYHLSHFPTGIKLGDLRPISETELKTVGLAYKDFNPVLVGFSMNDSRTYGKANVLYGVPLDTHTVVVYYNKDILKQAGVLGADGKPTPVMGAADFVAMLKKIKDSTGLLPITTSSGNDTGGPWRLWYTLYSQMGGTFVKNGALDLSPLDTIGKKALQTFHDWAAQGLINTDTDYGPAVALFTSGKAAFMINGNWEVPTMVDLAKSAKLGFDFGVMAFPKLFGTGAAFADSHELAIPNNTKSPISPAKLKGVLTFIAYVEKHADVWAGGGHLPAYLPVLNGPELAAMSPNNQYTRDAAKIVSFEPNTAVFGVGGTVYTAFTNFMTPALTDQISIEEAIRQFKAEITKLSM
jgi:multiple sugar transport system substrate-binding protein